MAEPSTKVSSKISFVISPEPRHAQVDLSQGNFVDIVIVAQNRSGRPVRVQAILVPIGSETAFDLEPLSPGIWAPWISFQETASEVNFETDGNHRFRVRISLPPNAPLGSYQFRLILSGVENPDEEFAASDPITFTITGPQTDIRPFAIGAAVILALVILGIIAAVLLINQSSPLRITLEPPEIAVQGVPAEYILTITNPRTESTRNVMIDYTLPDSVVAATASVRGETLRLCHYFQNEGRIRCDLGILGEYETVKIDFLVIPGPAAKTLTNTRAFTILTDLDKPSSAKPIKPDASRMETNVTQAPDPFAVALLPSTSTPLVGKDFNYQVLVWSTVTTTQQVTLTFTLPAGMRYTKPMPTQCSPHPSEYFTVDCRVQFSDDSKAAITRFNLPAQATSSTISSASLKASSSNLVGDDIERTARTKAVNPSLYFNGLNDWVELGYMQAPKSFTIEMWVHPYSSNDGQSFAGLHREEPDGTVSNLFLVGYWSGSLQVNLNDQYHNLDIPKRTDRYHLAVVVDGSSGNHSEVSVYVDGKEQPWSNDFQGTFTTTLPGGENTLPWVLGQDWDTGSQGKKRSDFFHGTLSEVRIWQGTRSPGDILDNYPARLSGHEDGLQAYYRLEPVDLESDALVSHVASANPGHRWGATWVEAAPLFGGALRFNGLNDALHVPDLQFTKFKANEDHQVEVTLAGWVFVDAIPSQKEWILGSTVPSGSTLAPDQGDQPEAPATAADQAALVSAQIELLAAQQAAQELNLDAEQVAADGKNARQWLFYSLNSLGLDEIFTQKNEVLQVKATDLFNTTDLLYSASDLAPLAANTSTLEIANYASAMQVHFARYEALKNEYDEASSIAISEPSLSEPVQSEQPLSKEMLVFLMADERVQYDTNLQGLLEAADRTGFKVMPPIKTMTPTTVTDQNLESFPPYAVMRSLARLERAEQDLTTTNSTGEQAGAEWIVAFQSLQSAQETLSQAAVGLETWLQTELQATLQASYGDDQGSDQADIDYLTLQLQASIDKLALQQSKEISDKLALQQAQAQAYIANLAAVQYNLQRYQSAQNNLQRYQATQEQIDTAQDQVDAAQAQAEAVAESSRQAQAEAAYRQQLEENVIQAELAASAAHEDLAAQRRLETARIELENALLDQYHTLLSSMEALQVRETTLADLEPRLDFAVDRATEAAFSAARRYNVERWIGPFLDRILGTRTPLQSAQEAIRPAALLAAQQVLKNSADAKVDMAEKELKDALEKQDRLANSNGRTARRQQIIDQINAYLDSLNKDVNAAQQKKDEAQAEQQGDLGESQIPAVLAEALAQAVADQVTTETIRRLPFADTRKLLSSSAGMEALAKTAIRANVANALEISRQPVRIQLYYQSTYAIQRLDTELAAGGLSASERSLKSALRSQLAAVNTALLRLLNTQNVLLRPASGLDALVGQVADETQAAASIDILAQELQDALDKASFSLQTFLGYAQAQGRTSGLSLPASGESAASDTAVGTAAADTTGGTEGGTEVPTPGVIDQEQAGPSSEIAAPESIWCPDPNSIAGPVPTGQIETAPATNHQPPNLWFGLLADDDGHIMLAARPANGGSWTWEKDEKPLTIGQWVHYAVVIRYDDQTGAIKSHCLYRDGSQVKGVKGVKENVPTWIFSTPRCPLGFYIGGLCDTNGRFYFAGQIDEVRVWNRALGQNEIDAWRMIPGAVSDEWAYWAFDDGPGRSSADTCSLNKTCDLSKNGGFHLTVQGPSWIEADLGLVVRTNESP